MIFVAITTQNNTRIEEKKKTQIWYTSNLGTREAPVGPVPLIAVVQKFYEPVTLQ